MADLLQQVENAIVEQRLLTDGDRVLLAVSGGVDSMVLLHVLHRLRQAHRWSLVVAHFNHELRGRSSNADERLVQRVCARLGLPFHADRTQVKAHAERTGLSIEMAARQCRHDFLARTARRRRIRKVALAHHADDQVELFFLRLMRGAGPEGLAGMKAKSASPAHPAIELIRPLLAVTRSEIEGYARQERIAFRHDATNDEIAFQRNWIRHKLLPFIRDHFQAGIDPAVLRTMGLVRGESEFVGETAAKAVSTGGAAFDDLHLAIQRRWLQSECLRLEITPEFELIEKLRSSPDQEFMVSPERLIRRDARGRVHARRLTRATFKGGGTAVKISAGKAIFGDVTFSWRIERWRGWPNGKRVSVPGLERFDADKVGGSIVLRHWRPGDRFQPIGMATPVKVQDLFTNLRVPRTARLTAVVAEAANGEIFWIEGLRISERFKIDERTERCLAWRWSQPTVAPQLGP